MLNLKIQVEMTTNEQPLDNSQHDAKLLVMRRFYWLRRFRFARKKIGSAWIKTAYRGWITYQTYCDYNAYGFDPVALASEEDGVIKWTKNAA